MSDVRRLAGISGILFVVVTVVAFLMPGPPPKIDEANSEILKYLEDGRTAILVSQWLTFISAIPAALLFGYFVTLLRKAEGEPGALTVAALLLLAITAVIASIIAGVFAAAGYEAKHGLDEDGARLLWDVLAVGINGQMAAMGGFQLISGWIILSKGGLPTWSGWIGVVAGAIGIAGSAMMASDGALAPAGDFTVFPFLAFLIFSLALSILFLRSEK